MIVFNREELQNLLDGFAGGFEGSLTYLIIFIVLVILIILFLIFTYTMVKGREERRLSAAIAERNRKIFAAHMLDSDELDFIDELSRYLNDPRKKYTLLTDPRTFATAVQKARSDGGQDERAVASLQKKLGIDARSYVRTLQSTVDIRPGIPVVLEIGDAGRIPGTVRKQTGEGVLVSLKSGTGSVSQGMPVVLYCHDERGVFVFHSSISKVDGDTLVITHSKEVRHAQRRAYFRGKVVMPVVVESETDKSGAMSTKTIDLGGGGASMINPGGVFSVGDDVRLSFTKDESLTAPLHGEIVRTSKGGRVAHVRFGHMSASVRDRIIRMVYDR